MFYFLNLCIYSLNSILGAHIFLFSPNAQDLFPSTSVQASKPWEEYLKPEEEPQMAHQYKYVNKFIDDERSTSRSPVNGAERQVFYPGPPGGTC
jgi:hypothetical protein